MGEFTKTDSGAVINTDHDDYVRYKMQRDRAQRDRQLLNRIDQLEQQVESLKQAMIKLNSKVQ